MDHLFVEPNGQIMNASHRLGRSFKDQAQYLDT